MGYYISQRSAKFSMRQENIPKAFEALKIRTLGNHPSWTEVILAKNFDDASAEYGFEFDYDEKGNIVDITFTGEKASTEDEFFTTIGPYVEVGSYVEFSGEEAEHWRYRFDGEKCIEEDANITYASDTDKDGLYHDEALIRPAIADEDKAEFVGQIVDIMEDFLEEKGIVLDNPDRENYGEDPNSLANIFGEDYDYIADRVKEILLAWKLVESKSDD